MADGRAIEIEDAAGAGANIEQFADPVRRQQGKQLALHLARVGVQRAQPMPFGGIAPEIGGRRFGPAALDRLQPLGIQCEQRIGLRHQFGEGLPQLRARTGLRQPVIGPGTFAHAHQQAGFAQQLQMARHTRLALPDDLHQVADGQLRPGAQCQQAQAGRLRGGAQAFQQKIRRQGGGDLKVDVGAKTGLRHA